MARRRTRGPRPHKFSNKLVLNQWLIDQFGVDPLREHRIGQRIVRPWHVLVDPIKDPRMEGLDGSDTHRFFHNLVDSELFRVAKIDRMPLLRYEEHLVRHTHRINDKRHRPVAWKYFPRRS